jgi:hypothetical protein
MGVVLAMSPVIDTGLNGKRARGAAMEAHAGTISIGARRVREPRRKRLAALVAAVRRGLNTDAERAYRRQRNGKGAYSVPGSEHTHLIRRPRGF